MEILIKASLAVTLLLTVSANSSAQPLTVSATSSVQPPACLDGTPHKKTLVPFDNGVQLQVLDWGGADKLHTMVLPTGLGDNTHVNDQFAFQFTDYFHVIGITRRGFLPSSQPAGRRLPHRRPPPISAGKLSVHMSELLIRHADARKAAYLRRGGNSATLEDQIRTVHLNPTFRKEIQGRSIVVIDDFTTQGHSFEWAINVLLNAGVSRVICTAIGKYGHRYGSERYARKGIAFDSFVPCTLGDNDFASRGTNFVYDDAALREMRDSFQRWRTK